MARRAHSRRQFRGDATRRGLAIAALALPLVASAVGGGPGRLVVSGNAALLPSVPLPSLVPSGVLPSILPTPVPSAAVTCVPLPPPIGNTCTGEVLTNVPGALPSSAPTNPAPGGGGPTPGGRPTQPPNAAASGRPSTATGSQAQAPVLVALPAIAPVQRGQLSGVPIAQDTLGPGGFALLLSTGIRGGLSLGAGHVWPYLAVGQAILLVGLLLWAAARRVLVRPRGS